jgi:hypothetical protein
LAEACERVEEDGRNEKRMERRMGRWTMRHIVRLFYKLGVVSLPSVRLPLHSGIRSAER